MAFSFRNIIDNMKNIFTPSEYLNVDTGEVIKKRQLKSLSDVERESYIKADEFDLKKEYYPQPKKPKLNIRKKAEVKSQKVKQKVRKENKPSVSKSDSIGIKKKPISVTPKKPPKKLEKQLEKNMQQEPPTIDGIESLKKRISELENIHKINLDDSKGYLLSIIEDTELTVDNPSIYEEYLKEHEEEISTLLNYIEYHVSKQEQLNAPMTQLATILNMGALSLMQAENLSTVIEQAGWDLNVE